MKTVTGTLSWLFPLLILSISSLYAETALKKEVLNRQESSKPEDVKDIEEQKYNQILTEGLSPASSNKKSTLSKNASIAEEVAAELHDEKENSIEESDDELADSEPEGSLEDELNTLADGAPFPDSLFINLQEAYLPCEGTRITSPYGIRKYRMHKGIDIKVQVGDTIRAAFSGQISRVNYERRGYGHYIFVEHPNLSVSKTVYAHLSKKLVKAGQMVEAGEAIGLAGNSGRSTGSHLHFEIRIQNTAIDPAAFFDFENQTRVQDTLVLSMLQIKSEQDAIEKELAKHRYHKIRSGDNLGKIARKYGTTIDKICRLNGIKRTTTLRIGKMLRCS